jgi:tetratricopeptide (TPR) repeat protein
MSKQECIKLIELAWEQFEKKDFQSSADSFEEVLDVEDENVDALFGRACAQFRIQDFDAAEKDLNKLIKINPSDFKALHVRALIKGADENIEGAVKDLEKVVEIDPENAEACQDLAFSYFAIEQYGKAAETFDKLVELHKNCPQGWCGKGLVALYKKELKKAIEYFNLAIKAEPNYLLALLARGDAYMEMSKISDAQRDIKKVLGIEPKVFDKKSEDNDNDDDDDDDNMDDDAEIEEFELDD